MVESYTEFRWLSFFFTDDSCFSCSVLGGGLLSSTSSGQYRKQITPMPSSMAWRKDGKKLVGEKKRKVLVNEKTVPLP